MAEKLNEFLQHSQDVFSVEVVILRTLCTSTHEGRHVQMGGVVGLFIFTSSEPCNQ